MAAQHGLAGRLILITGGVRSGKSDFAERCAARLAAPGHGGVAYVATAQIWDEEMAARVARHRAARPAAWRTIEAPYQLMEGISRALEEGASVVLVDSIDFWVSNRLLREEPVSGDRLDPARVAILETTLLDEVASIVALHQRWGRAYLVLVTLEAGMGVVPPYPLGRAFRDLLGRVNRALAAAADAVYLLVAGLPVDLKRLSVTGAAELPAAPTEENETHESDDHPSSSS